MKTIVVGYDDSKPARRALERAAELAGAFGARLVVTSVAETMPALSAPVGPTPELMPLPPVGPPLDTSELHRRELDAARRFLEGRSVEADFVLCRGPADEAIVELAEQRGADLIVVGTREPGFLERLLGGSVSEGVAHSARCDVLVVHARE
jgi:nucleotide-binding universal stress UspA family protein